MKNQNISKQMEVKELSYAELDQQLIDEANKKYETTKAGLSTDFTHEELYDALDFTETLFMSAMVLPIVLNPIAKQVRAESFGKLSGDGIHAAIKRSQVSEYVKSAMYTWSSTRGADIEFRDDEIFLIYKGVPINIQILPDSTYFIKNPDVVFFHALTLYTPNPFKQYDESTNND